MVPQSPYSYSSFSPWDPGILSLAVYAGVIIVLIVLLLGLTSWLGVKNRTTEKLRPYESGIIPTGMARFHYPVPFYLVATFFLIFDVEVAYIFSWAVAFDRLGWLGWLQISFFMFVLLLSLYYVWAKGGLDWGRRGVALSS
jgi:NADH-quinone oxidoreductase subunit A